MGVQASCDNLEVLELDEVPMTPAEYNTILEFQQEILQMIASHKNSTKVLENLCFLAEKLLPNSVASIMLLDKTTGLLSVLSAPSIPQAGHDALSNLKPGIGMGSCASAFFHNEPQFVANTFKDITWTDVRKVAIDFNICSCWSMPVRSQDNKPLGTFALSSFEHRSPAPFHKKLLETAASIVNIVLKNQENDRTITLLSLANANAVEGIIITDEENKIVEVNNAFMNIYGYEKDFIIGKDPKFIASQLHNKNFYKDMWESIQKTDQWSGEIINRNSQGEEVIQWMSISSIHDEDGNPKNYLAIFSDLTELKKAQSKIENMLLHDELTALHNKTYLEQLLKSNKKQTLILLNVNNFSYINTAYGFKTGDKLLIKIANILKDNFTTDATCRINSDEFALLFSKKININTMVSEIKNCFYSQGIKVDTTEINISFSFGAIYGKYDLLRNAALALKRAKENGKNNLYIFNYTQENINHSQREAFIQANNLLHNALNEDRVIPFFQGIRDNETHKIIKFESLVRIEEDGEIISPFVFLKVAKLSGLLPEITRVMIDKSFAIMQDKTYTFSINITEDDLNSNYLVEYLEEISLQYHIATNRVILEILEGISSNGKKNHINQLTELKRKGYSLAIDDFGSEYSNFERVLDLDIDFLKIDAKYIKDIHTNKKSYEITRAIAFFAKNANIPCIAEFVHNQEVQNIIEALGIEFSQGYLFSEPNSKPQAVY